MRALAVWLFPLALLAQSTRAPALVDAAAAAMARGDSAQALDSLRAALQADPANADALYYLAKLSAVIAQMQLQRLAELEPDGPRLRQMRGEALRGREDREGARREFLAVLAASPKFVPALVALAEMDRTEGRCDQAEPRYRQARLLAPDLYEAAYGAGACLLTQGKLDAALEALQAASALDPESLAARFALGSALLRAGKPAAAVTHLEWVAARDAKEKQTFALLGQAYQRLGRASESAKAFSRYRALNAGETK